MPKAPSVLDTGVHAYDPRLVWAAGVLDAKATILPIVRAGMVVGGQVYVIASPAVTSRLAEILGGTDTGKAWRLPPDQQEVVLSRVERQMHDPVRLSRIQAILGFRRSSLGQRGQPLTPAVREWRKKLVRRMEGNDDRTERISATSSTTPDGGVS